MWNESVNNTTWASFLLTNSSSKSHTLSLTFSQAWQYICICTAPKFAFTLECSCTVQAMLQKTFAEVKAVVCELLRNDCGRLKMKPLCCHVGSCAQWLLQYVLYFKSQLFFITSPTLINVKHSQRYPSLTCSPVMFLLLMWYYCKHNNHTILSLSQEDKSHLASFDYVTTNPQIK